MGIKRLNHAVLYVRDATRQRDFYRDVLGFRVANEDPAGRFVFMIAPDSINDHDIGFFTIGDGASDTTAGKSTVGLYHLAWEVPTLGELKAMRDRLTEVGALVGASDHNATKSLYAKDPDGIEFEVMWPVPLGLLNGNAAPTIAPLDLDAEIARFGADTPGAATV